MWKATKTLSKHIPTYLSSTSGTYDFIATANDKATVAGVVVETYFGCKVDFINNQINSYLIFEDNNPELEILGLESNSTLFSKKDITLTRSTDTKVANFYNSLYSKEKLNPIVFLSIQEETTLINFKVVFKDIQRKNYPALLAEHPDLVEIIVSEPLLNFKTTLSKQQLKEYKFKETTVLELIFRSELTTLSRTSKAIFNFLTSCQYFTVDVLDLNNDLDVFFVEYKGRVYSLIDSSFNIKDKSFFIFNKRIYFIDKL